MKINFIVKFAALLLICCAMLGCEKKKEETKTTTIYGTVFDAHNNEPITGAKIEVGYLSSYSYGVNDYFNISNNGFPLSSSISGSDGQYEISFGEVPDNEGYYIYITRSGYDRYCVVTGVQTGSSYRMDFNLNPL